MSNDLEDAILEPRGCSTPGACSAVGPIRTLKAEVELIKKGWQVDIRRIDQLAAERDRLRAQILRMMDMSPEDLKSASIDSGLTLDALRKSPSAVDIAAYLKAVKGVALIAAIHGCGGPPEEAVIRVADWLEALSLRESAKEP